MGIAKHVLAVATLLIAPGVSAQPAAPTPAEPGAPASAPAAPGPAEPYRAPAQAPPATSSSAEPYRAPAYAPAAPPAAPYRAPAYPSPSPSPADALPPAEPPPPPHPRETAIVTPSISPLHLFLPVVELTVEFRPLAHLGIAVIGGYGSYEFEDRVEDVRVRVLEIGGQVVWYPQYAFGGLQLGAEVVWLDVESDEFRNGTVLGTATGLAIGPLIGYKLMTSAGFTFVAQGGFQYVTAQGEASDQFGTVDSAEDEDFVPLLNLNLGWSF